MLCLKVQSLLVYSLGKTATIRKHSFTDNTAETFNQIYSSSSPACCDPIDVLVDHFHSELPGIIDASVTVVSGRNKSLWRYVQIVARNFLIEPNINYLKLNLTFI